jgi:hypothetical protein
MIADHGTPSRHAVALVAVCALLATPGCKGPEPEPIMTVELAFGDTELACAEAGITLVDFVLLGAEGVVRREEAVPCGELEFSFIEDDDYQMEVVGYSEDGVVRFEGSCEGLAFASEDVLHRCVVEVAVGPLAAEIRWDTSQTDQFVPATCWIAGVVRYNLVLRDAADEVVFAQAGVSCDGPDAVVVDFGSVPLGMYELEVVGYSDDEAANWEGTCPLQTGTVGVQICDARDE